MRYIILLVVHLFSAQPLYADSYEQARNAGKEIGQAGSGKSSQILNSGLDQNLSGNITAAEALNFQGTDIPESKLAHVDLEAESKRSFLDPNNEHVKLIKSADENLDAVELNTNNTKFDRAKDAQKNPENYIDWLTSKYSDCINTGGEEVNYENYKVCDIYHGISENACKIGKLLEVDAKHSYECVKERNTYNKNCKKSLKVWCDRKPDCDSGGIITSSVASDMQFSYSYPELLIGTIADNYWQHSCGAFERITKFKIKNIKDVTEAVINRVGFDDYMLVKVNGHMVFNEPYGGTILEIEKGRVAKTNEQLQSIKTSKRFFSRGGHSCELSINNNYPVNIDIMPYLKEGDNEIFIKVVVAGFGEGWINIKTRQHCCIEKQEWEEKCD